MDFPIRFPGQIRQQLRALRKTKGLTQTQLGKLLGIGQVRIAEIERDCVGQDAAVDQQCIAISRSGGKEPCIRLSPDSVGANFKRYASPRRALS